MRHGLQNKRIFINILHLVTIAQNWNNGLREPGIACAWVTLEDGDDADFRLVGRTSKLFTRTQEHLDGC